MHHAYNNKNKNRIHLNLTIWSHFTTTLTVQTNWTTIPNQPSNSAYEKTGNLLTSSTAFTYAISDTDDEELSDSRSCNIIRHTDFSIGDPQKSTSKSLASQTKVSRHISHSLMHNYRIIIQHTSSYLQQCCEYIIIIGRLPPVSIVSK